MVWRHRNDGGSITLNDRRNHAGTFSISMKGVTFLGAILKLLVSTGELKVVHFFVSLGTNNPSLHLLKRKYYRMC